MVVDAFCQAVQGVYSPISTLVGGKLNRVSAMFLFVHLHYQYTPYLVFS